MKAALHSTTRTDHYHKLFSCSPGSTGPNPHCFIVVDKLLASLVTFSTKTTKTTALRKIRIEDNKRRKPRKTLSYLTLLFHCLLLILSAFLLSRLAVKEWRRNFPRFLKTRNIPMSSIRITVQERKAVNHDETTYG